MDNQEKIKWLKQYQHLDHYVNRLLEEKERYKSIALKVTPTWSDMPKGGGGENPREAAICKIIDIEKEIDKAIDEYVDLRVEIDLAINKIEDMELRLLLQYRYVDGITWEWVAVNMGFTFQWVHILHKRALEQLQIKNSKS